MFETVALVVWAALLCLPSIGLKIFLLLPATAAHELSHWLVALFSGARPGLPSLFPRKRKEGWILGHVIFDVSPGTAGVIALAPPLLCGGVALFVWAGAPAVSLEGSLARGVLLAYLVHAATPSATDILIALKDPLGLGLSLFGFLFLGVIFL